MKLLHSADWHLDSPIQGRTPEQETALRRALLALPGQVARAALAEGCELMLLSGDIFDGPATPESLEAVKAALKEAGMPVFIAPGNHDYAGPGSPWVTELWPENVHIFLSDAMESVTVPGLDCRVYGAGFRSPHCGPLLEGFRAQCAESHAVAVLHGDPTQSTSPYCPVTQAQVRESGLDYLALGHIHKADSFRAGDTLCAWPGCAMGRGFDELGEKGVYIVTLEGAADARFLPLNTPRFHWLEAPAGTDPLSALSTLLPAGGSEDHYRVDLTGESGALDPDSLAAAFPQFPNLTVRDKTELPLDLWAGAGDDTLEGVYFRLLRDAMEDADEEMQERIRLAAKISRRILAGREVKLP